MFAHLCPFSSSQFFATDAGFSGAAEACSLAIFLLNVLFIIYWVYVWWLHSEYRAKAAETGKNTYIATRKAVNLAAVRTSDGVRTMHGAVRSKIIRVSKSKSINNSVNAQKKKKKKRPSCLLTEENFAESEEEVLPRAHSTDITVNSVLHEVKNPLDQANNVELEMSITHRPSMLASAVKEESLHGAKHGLWVSLR